MNPILATRLAWSVFRSPSVSRKTLDRMQNRKLRRIIDHAYRHVPYYRKLFESAGVDPGSIRSVADLKRVPITTKKDLQLAGADAVSAFYKREDLVTRRTSGSSGEPITLFFDHRFEWLRGLVFMRALMATGYRLGNRTLLMKPDSTKRRQKMPGWVAIRYDESPASIMDRLEAFRPAVLYGWVTPLLAFSEYLRSSGRRVNGIRAVVTTAESLDSSARRDLERGFSAPVFDIYGLTEMGTVAWECQGHDGYHVSEDLVFVEYTPYSSTTNEYSTVMTNLELTAMPMIRYQTEDVVRAHESGDCSCGRNFFRIGQVSGRAVDCLRLPGGNVVSPYAITLALESVSGLRRYQLIQESPVRCRMRCEVAPDNVSVIVHEVRRTLASVLGDVQIDVQIEDQVRTPGDRKFRVVESRINS
jgi:phenylacetate-CoA ligase